MNKQVLSVFGAVKQASRQRPDLSEFSLAEIDGALGNNGRLTLVKFKGAAMCTRSREIVDMLNGGLLISELIEIRRLRVAGIKKVISPIVADDIMRSVTVKSVTTALRCEIKVKNIRGDVSIKSLMYASVTYEKAMIEVKFLKDYPVYEFKQTPVGYSVLGDSDNRLYIATTMIASVCSMKAGMIFHHGQSYQKSDSHTAMHSVYMAYVNGMQNFTLAVNDMLTYVIDAMKIDVPSACTGIDFAHLLYVKVYGSEYAELLSSGVFRNCKIFGLDVLETVTGQVENEDVYTAKLVNNAKMRLPVVFNQTDDFLLYNDIVEQSRSFRGVGAAGISGLTQSYVLPGFGCETNMRIAAVASDVFWLLSHAKSNGQAIAGVRLMVEKSGFNQSTAIGVARLLPRFKIYTNMPYNGVSLPVNLDYYMKKRQEIIDFYGIPVKNQSIKKKQNSQTRHEFFSSKSRDKVNGIVESVALYRETENFIAYYSEASYAMISKRTDNWFAPSRIHAGYVVVLRGADISVSRGMKDDCVDYVPIENNAFLLYISICMSNFIRDFLPWTRRCVTHFAQRLNVSLYMNPPRIGSLGSSEEMIGHVDGYMIDNDAIDDDQAVLEYQGQLNINHEYDEHGGRDYDDNDGDDQPDVLVDQRNPMGDVGVQNNNNVDDVPDNLVKPIAVANNVPPIVKNVGGGGVVMIDNDNDV